MNDRIRDTRYKSLGHTLVASILFFSTQALADYSTEVVVEGLEHPWSMDFLPDGRILITERTGTLRIVDTDGKLLDEPVKNVPEAWVENQAGLFEVKLSPDFADTNRIYLSYACGERDNSSTCLTRAVFTGNRLSKVEEIFRSSPGRGGSAHYGGRFAFLPDETIVLGLGDGFDYREQAQKPENHLGSVVRLNMDGSIPDDNPFVGLSQTAPETYSYGHRNVQGIVYDEQSDRLYTNEHGPQGGDELNLMQAGGNYGWPLLTGGLDYNNAKITPYTELPGMISAILEWTPSIAPSGMTLYRGDAFSDWRGDLFVSALAKKKVQRVRLSGNQVTEQEDLFTELDRRIRYVYTGPDGYLYLLTDEKNGQLIRVTP